MTEIDELLSEAGARWRAAQPPAADLDLAAVTREEDASGRWLRFAAGLAAAAVVVVAIGIVTQLGERGPSGPIVGDDPAASEGIGAACAVTRPDPAFVAPSPYPAVAPALYESDWYGSEELWTMLAPDGEAWAVGGQKTFWWSTAWAGASADPEPAIRVTATRLDGPGSAESEPGTNAIREDFGEAMLVGIEIPSAGCWEITATYRGATLAYVVEIVD